MPRKTELTIEQINEILQDRASGNTLAALKRFLAAEKKRREKAGIKGGRPRVNDGKRAEQLRKAQAKWRDKRRAQTDEREVIPIDET